MFGEGKGLVEHCNGKVKNCKVMYRRVIQRWYSYVWAECCLAECSLGRVLKSKGIVWQGKESDGVVL